MEELIAGRPEEPGAPDRTPNGLRPSVGTTMVALDLGGQLPMAGPVNEVSSDSGPGDAGPGSSPGPGGLAQALPWLFRSGPNPGRTPFAQWVAREADRLLGTAYLLTGDRERAEELLRTALAEAGVGWVCRWSDPRDDVLRAMVRTYLGRWWWLTAQAGIEPAPLPGQIGAGLNRLSARRRVVTVLRYHAGLTEDESAAVLRAPAGNVRSWISQALDLLGIDTRLDLRPEAGPGLSRSGFHLELEALAALATDAPSVPADSPSVPADSPPIQEDRLADVRSRLPAARRREQRRRLAYRVAAGVTSLALLAGALAIAGPGADPAVDTADPGTSAVPARAPGGPSDPRYWQTAPDEMKFLDDVAGYSLIATTIGQRGEGELVLRFTPSTTRLAISSFCRSWYDIPLGQLWSAATLNGHPLTQAPCDRVGGPNASTVYPDEVALAHGTGWAALGVRAGQESVLRLSMVSPDGARTDNGWAWIGVGIYELTGPR